MSDRRLRELERRWMETGDHNDRRAYNQARVRSGLPKLPREVIRHYIDEDQHGHLEGGKFSLSDVVARRRSTVILSTCKTELWPREIGQIGLRSTFRKNIYFTEDRDEVTCKRCLATLNKPAERAYYRTHYAPGSKDRSTSEWVCGGVDGPRFVSTVSYTMRTVNCPRCKRVMERGRRQTRRPRTEKPIPYKFRVPGPLDGLAAGNFPVQ